MAFRELNVRCVDHHGWTALEYRINMKKKSTRFRASIRYQARYRSKPCLFTRRAPNTATTPPDDPTYSPQADLMRPSFRKPFLRCPFCRRVAPAHGIHPMDLRISSSQKSAHQIQPSNAQTGLSRTAVLSSQPVGCEESCVEWYGIVIDRVASVCIEFRSGPFSVQSSPL